jgi:TonB family protein
MNKKILVISVVFFILNLQCFKNDEKLEESKPNDSTQKIKAAKDTKDMIDKMTSAVDKLPEVVKQGPVIYPEEDVKKQVQGTIYLRLLIDKDGIVKNIEVFKNDGGSKGMEKSAADAAYKTIYKPAQKDGKTVECSVVVPYKFRLQ